MARIATTQLAILEAVKRRIVAQCGPMLNENTVIITDAEEPPDGTQNSTVATLWVTDGNFDEALHEGGGADQTVEYAGVEITLFSRNWSDRKGLGAQSLREASRGLLELKRSLLAAFSAHDLQDADGNELLVNLMAPLSAARPRKTTHKDKPLADLQLAFSTDFLWDLSEA